MTVRVIELKKRRVNRLNKSIPKKTLPLEKKGRVFWNQKGRRMFFK
jgi:hypothetical protein